MGCNCRKTRPMGVTTQTTTVSAEAKGTTQSFALEVNGTRTQTFGSRLEAEATNRRAWGGRGTVKPA